MDNRIRSPYGIMNPGSPPRPHPWYVHLINLVSTKSAALAKRYAVDNTSGQIPNRGDMATVLQASWHRPTQPKADPVTQPTLQPSDRSQWPSLPGSRWSPSNRTFKMDARPVLTGHLRPAYLPLPERYDRFSSAPSQYQGPSIPRTNPYSQDYLPTRFDTRIPARITRPHRMGLALMGGVQQHGTRQTWGQWGESIIIPPPGFTRTPSQSVRSVAGVLSPRPGTGRERIPAVFTPTQVQ